MGIGKRGNITHRRIQRRPVRFFLDKSTEHSEAIGSFWIFQKMLHACRAGETEGKAQRFARRLLQVSDTSQARQFKIHGTVVIQRG